MTMHHHGPFKKPKHPYFQRRFEVFVNGERVETFTNSRQHSDYRMLIKLRDKYLKPSNIHEFTYDVYKIIPSVFPEWEE